MAKAPIIAASSLLKDTFRKRKLRLNKLVLFGSYARRRFRKDSDIDLIVVSRDFRKRSYNQRIKIMEGINRMLVNALDKPVDLFYFSDEEWRRGHSLIIEEAKTSGKSI